MWLFWSVSSVFARPRILEGADAGIRGFWRFPAWVDVIGAVCGWASVAGIIWVHEHLGRNWSPWVQDAQVQTLVKTGPYSICRHPIYFVFMLYMVPIVALSSCWYTLASVVGATLLMLCRIPREDAILEGIFGDEFRAWKKVTPAIIPYGCCLRQRSNQPLLDAS